MDRAELLQSLFGVALIVAVVALAQRKQRALLDESRITRALATSYPEWRQAPIRLSADRRAALILPAEDARFGVAFLLGAKPVIWALPRIRLETARRERDRLIIATGEPTRPHLALRMASDTLPP